MYIRIDNNVIYYESQSQSLRHGEYILRVVISLSISKHFSLDEIKYNDFN